MRRLLVLILLVVSVGAFAIPIKRADLVGHWRSLFFDDQESTITLNDDGTGYLEYEGKAPIPFKWSADESGGFFDFWTDKMRDRVMIVEAFGSPPQSFHFAVKGTYSARWDTGTMVK